MVKIDIYTVNFDGVTIMALQSLISVYFCGFFIVTCVHYW